MTGNHAIVFGASGITGWAIVNEILKGYPAPESFDSVTAMTNRPLPLDVTLWPNSEKLQVVSGVDLLTSKGQVGLEEELIEKVKHIKEITHVYFCAYIMDPKPEHEISINVDLLTRGIPAIEKLSPNLKFVLLPTGTKAYGVHIGKDFPFAKNLPLRETLPRIPEPYASQMFYYNQVDMLSSLSKGKAWTWAEIIPDNIIGFVPNNNIHCMAQALGLYLSLFAEINGKGAEVVFPGTEKSWTNVTNESSQDLCARVSILASLRPETTSEQRYNAADNPEPSSWSKKWPVICEYFGLKGVGPPAGGHGPDPTEYCQEHFEEWKQIEKKHGLVTGRLGNNRSLGVFPLVIMRYFDFDRTLDLTKQHEMMGKEKQVLTTADAWYTAFDRFRAAHIIP